MACIEELPSGVVLHQFTRGGDYSSKSSSIVVCNASKCFRLVKGHGFRFRRLD